MTDIGGVVRKLQELRDRLSAGEQALVDDLLRAAGVVETTPVEYNPYLPDVHTNPYPHYHQIQANNPVHWSHAMQSWVIARHADVAAALRDVRLSYRTGSETIMACVPDEEHPDVRAVSRLLGSLLNEIDPPDHTRLRRLMTRALAVTMEPQQASHIELIANRLIDAVQPTGHLDIVEDFAYPLPAIIGADLLGIPDGDRHQFGQSIDNVVHTFSEGFSGTAAMRRGEESVIQLTDYLKKLLTERRERPGHDVLTAMLQSHEATEDERVLMAANITMGMYENVTHAISLSMNTILQTPGLLEYFRSCPDNILSSVEEMLRHEGTAPILSRVALEDIEIGGVTIPKGQRVILLLAAANRDTECFDKPDTFLPERRPNPHIAFGVGKRACPGSALARTMIHVAIATLVTRLPDMRLADSSPKWREEINIHGLRTLPIRFSFSMQDKEQPGVGFSSASPIGCTGMGRLVPLTSDVSVSFKRSVKAAVATGYQQVAPGWHRLRNEFKLAGSAITAAMLKACQLTPGMRVLDVACGAGEPALSVAPLVAPNGEVVAIDLVSEMLPRGQDATNRADNIRFMVADGEALPFKDGVFDVVTCRSAIMHFPDPFRAVSEAYRVLRPGGRAVISALGPAEETPAIMATIAILLRHASPQSSSARGPDVYRFGIPGTLSALFIAAGFREVDEEMFTAACPWPADAVRFWQVLPEHAWRVRDLIGLLTPETREQVDREVIAALRRYEKDGILQLTAPVVMACGTR